MLQVRPLPSNPEALGSFYSPQRDLSNAGPYLVRLAALSIDNLQSDPELQGFLAQEGVTEDDLANTAGKLAQLVTLIVREKTPQNAMDLIGFETMPRAARLAFFYKMGQVLLAATWAAVKDKHVAQSGTPRELQDILEDVQAALAEYARPRVATPESSPN